ncbi:hypothetical protein P154DRAFT_440066 [Amniculicola lignicola CBS 123094]|uniref:PLAC8-domain-containing protein n=1 Tax=Amniculicola lignicola CBS 123094 TaxID=1392246 RepID=A0A6A5WD01_9PLEO|nr:hypothetical protein P154DRAFT_440066 [Amniculicola lignicola CBS 123094]
MSGVIDQKEINDWVQRAKTDLNNKKWSSASPVDAREYKNSFWGCFSPPDLCCITCCLPCVTFGKTHHRLRKNANMEGYETVNTSCISFYLASCFGLHWVMQAMQAADVREKYNLQGSCTGDLVKSFCCLCCSVVQAEKESLEREAEKGTVKEQYGGETMVMQGGQQPPQQH